MSANNPVILALAGGVGGGKLARGLAEVLPPERLVIVVNTADDFTHLGLHISPDIDSVIYSLADRNDLERGWGLRDETWNFMSELKNLGGDTWFRLGDRDLAIHVVRTNELAAGRTLSQVTASLARQLGARPTVAPMSDDPVRSIVNTDEGALPFQDYFVRRQCRPRFLGVTFEGADAAKPSPALIGALERADAVVITPSNPFVSIDPILSLPGLRETLSRWPKPVIAVSPIVSGVAVKGPLAKMMREFDIDPSPLGVAGRYGPLVDGWIIDHTDRADAPAFEELGHRVRACDTLMRTLDDKARLAREVIDFARALALEPNG